MTNRLAWMVLLGVLSSPLPAADGRTPIPSTSPVVFPIQIAMPGSYTLTRDLTSGPQTVIEISATDVVLDLGGQTLSSGSFAAIIVSSGASARIRNGTLVGGSQGLSAGSGSSVVLEGLTIRDSTGSGVLTNSAETVVVQDCRIENTGSTGISIVGSGTQGAITNNALIATAGGIYVGNSASVAILDNHLDSIQPGPNGGVGIFVSVSDSVIVARNMVEASSGNSIWIGGGSDSCRLEENSVTGSGQIGILYDAADGMLRGNDVTGASGHGIQVRGHRNHVVGNVANSNSSWGLYLNSQSTKNIYGSNTARGNGGPECSGGGLNADFCNTGTGNESQGDNLIPGEL